MTFIPYRRCSRPAVAQVGIGMCGLVAFGHGPCTAVESVPNSRLVPAMMTGRRLGCRGGYRRAYRLRPETEQAQVLPLVGEWITCLRLVMEPPWPLAHRYHILLRFTMKAPMRSKLKSSHWSVNGKHAWLVMEPPWPLAHRYHILLCFAMKVPMLCVMCSILVCHAYQQYM